VMSEEANQETNEERRARIYPVILCEYNPVWPEWFSKEKEELEKLLNPKDIVRIIHFGSTSVPGLVAKPTIDILLEISETADLDELIAAMSTPDYFYLDESTLTMPTSPPHLVFLKGYLTGGFAEKVFHIHVRYPNDWDELYFRDYLIANPKAAAEYASLKRRLHQSYERDRDGYTAAKTEFVHSIVEKARRR